MSFSILWLSIIIIVLLSGSNQVLAQDAEGINKHAKLTIQDQNGDIIDCLDRKQQHLFKNSFPKNHTTQNVAEKLPKARKDGTRNSLDEVSQILVKNGATCPTDSIPILRKRMKTLNRTSLLNFKNRQHSLSRLIHWSDGIIDDNVRNKDHAEFVKGVVFLLSGIKKVTVRISVWHPFVEGNKEYSISGIFLHAGDNIVGAGWHVDPGVNDNTTRLFGFWTRDRNRKTGGYNMIHDQEFVSTSRSMTLGKQIHRSLNKVILVSLYKESEGWWLSVDGNPVGYWPFKIFTNLKKGLATRVELIGQVEDIERARGRHTKTQMGSGVFANAENGLVDSGYFSNLMVYDKNNIIPKDLYGKTYVSNEDCYNILPFHDDENYGDGFFYGGPGYDPKLCP